MSRTLKDSPNRYTLRTYGCGRWFEGPPSCIKKLWNRMWRRRYNHESSKEDPQFVNHRNEGKYRYF